MSENARNQISEAILNIGHSIDIEKGIPWGVGKRMPVYFDFRSFLGNYELRQLAVNTLVELVEKHESRQDELKQKGFLEEEDRYDLVTGLPTAGFAFAAGVADKLALPLVLLHEDKTYIFENIASLKTGKVQFDAIASTSPLAIPFGVKTADELQLPFIYVRKEKKGYGLNKLIEGLPENNAHIKKVMLIDYFIKDSYLDSAIETLENAGIIVENFITENIANRLIIEDDSSLEKKILLFIDDLISTGEKQVGDIRNYRNKGAIVNQIYVLLDYGFKKTNALFEPREEIDTEEIDTEEIDAVDKKKTKNFYQGCEIKFVKRYQDVLDKLRGKGISDEIICEIFTWREDHQNWYENKRKEELKMGNNPTIGQHLDETTGYSDLDLQKVVLITSGKSLTPYFVNAEKLCRDQNISKFLNENENNAAAIIEHAQKLTQEHPEFEKDIEIMAENVAELLKKGKGRELAISGGLRRDLIFSGPIARRLSLAHIALYKQDEGQGIYDDKVEIIHPTGEVELVNENIPFYVVHVADLMTKGSSSYSIDEVTQRKVGWIPMLRERKATVNDFVVAVTRLQGGETTLEAQGVTLHSFVEINKEYLDVHSNQPEIAAAYAESERKWTENYLKEHGVEILVPYFKEGQKKLKRAQSFMKLYKGFLEESGLMEQLDEAVYQEYGKSLNEII